jgi:hypothetical protein
MTSGPGLGKEVIMIEPEIGSALWDLERQAKTIVKHLFVPVRWTVRSDDGAVDRVANGVMKGFCDRLRQRNLDGKGDFADILDDITATDVLEVTRRGPATPYVGPVFGTRYESALKKVQDLGLLRRECRQMRMVLCLHPERAPEIITRKSLVALVKELGLQSEES